MPMSCIGGIHNGSFRFYSWSDHCAAQRIGGKTDTRRAAYPLHLPSVHRGGDIQGAMVGSKPSRSLHGRPIPCATLQVGIAESCQIPDSRYESADTHRAMSLSA